MRTTIVLVCLLLMATFASAGTVVLTFEGLQDQEPINNYYNGGLGGFGTGPGPNYGVSFTSDSLAIICQYHNCSNTPSGGTAAFFLTGAGDTMNVAAGFTTGFSFYYSAPYYTGSVNVYSGLNGTGTLLATLDLGLTPTGCDGSGKSYNCWVPIGVNFAGTAESVVFGGVADYIAFDDITLGSNVPGGAVPEPGSLLLLGTGLAGAVGTIRRKLGM